MLTGLKIDRIAESRLDGFDVDAVKFGEAFSDHMFSMVYEDGAWGSPEILPYGPIQMPPASISINYAQAVFEGMKAYRGDDGVLRLFRPYENAKRLEMSCRRLGIPPLDHDDFVNAIKALVSVDAGWVPDKLGYALYMRPIVFSIEDHIEVRPSRRYRFIVVTAPVGRYFESGGEGLSLKVEEQYTRVPPVGGLGAAKAAANYAGTLAAGEAARAEGFDQVVWLDGAERRYVEEAGLMNMFFKLGDAMVTPPIGDSVLPGITRDSLLTLLRDRGIEVAERRVPIDELVDAAGDGSLEEMFACGTAAVVAPIGRLSYRGNDLKPSKGAPGPLTQELYDTLTDIQYGRTKDQRGWTVAVHPAPEQHGQQRP